MPCFRALSTVALSSVLLSAEPVPTRAVADSCSGCEASGGQATTILLDDDQFIKITVDVTSGLCGGLVNGGACAGTSCTATITREWDLTAGTQLGFCSEVAGQAKTCRTPRPVAAGGAGSDTEGPKGQPCQTELTTYSFDIAGGFSAGQVIGCSKCE